MKNKKALGAALLIPSLFILIGFGQTVLERYSLEVNGTITQSKDTPRTGAPRYATEYVLEDDAGAESFYTAGATDASLPRSMPVGTTIKKAKGELGYTRNGELVNDFALPFYIITTGLGLIGTLFSLSLLVCYGKCKKKTE